MTLGEGQGGFWRRAAAASPRRGGAGVALGNGDVSRRFADARRTPPPVAPRVPRWSLVVGGREGGFGEWCTIFEQECLEAL